MSNFRGVLNHCVPLNSLFKSLFYFALFYGISVFSLFCLLFFVLNNLRFRIENQINIFEESSKDDDKMGKQMLMLSTRPAPTSPVCSISFHSPVSFISTHSLVSSLWAHPPPTSFLCSISTMAKKNKKTGLMLIANSIMKFDSWCKTDKTTVCYEKKIFHLTSYGTVWLYLFGKSINLNQVPQFFHRRARSHFVSMAFLSYLWATELCLVSICK